MPAEGHFTDGAFVRFLPRVGQPVAFQSAGALEPLVAGGTLIGLLPGVHPHVSGEVVGLDEALPALRTLKRPFPRVIANVYFQLRRRPETLPALLAHKRPLLRVRQVVSRQRAGASEQLAAVRAGVAHAGVQLRHVEVQAPFQGVGLSAVLTGEALVLGTAVAAQSVYPHGRVGPAALPTVPAQERGLLRVGPVVQFEAGRVEERFGALGALERQVARVHSLVPDQTLQAWVNAIAKRARERAVEMMYVDVVLVDLQEVIQRLLTHCARTGLVDQIVCYKSRCVRE